MTNIQENLGAEPNREDFVLISDEVVRGKINAQLEYITAREFLTPYAGLEAVRKILAYQNIFIPNTVFLDRTSGYDIFDAEQFGEKMGINNDGEVVTASSSPFKIYFEWKLNADGEYDIFCSIVTEDELDEILTDAEESEDEEEMNEEKKDVPFEGPYSKTVAPKTEKKKHNEVSKLARRAIKKVKKKLEEDYDHTAKQDAEDNAAIGKRARKPSEKAFWKKAHKKNSKKAVTGMDESLLGDIATGVGMGAVGGMIGAGTGMVLHGKYGKKKKSVADRLMDTKHEKSFQKYKIKQSDSSLKRATKPKTIERLNKQKSDAQDKLKKTSYWKSLLPEEQINEISDESKKKYLSHATDWGNAFRRPKPASLTGLHGGAESEKSLRKSLGNKMSSGEISTSKRFEKRLKDKYEKRKSIVKKVRKSLDEETLNELHGKTKEALKAIKQRITKKHDAEWQETYEKRKREKLKGGEKTKKEDKSRNDLAKRWLRADRAEKKLKDKKKK
jgi:hypothetical protein